MAEGPADRLRWRAEVGVVRPGRCGYRRGLLAVAGLLLTASSALPAQDDPSFTVETIYGTEAFAADSVTARWLPDGVHWTVVEADAGNRDEIWRVRAETGERVKLISATELVGSDPPRSLVIERAELSADGRRVLLFANAQRVWRQKTRGEYWVFDIATRRLIPVSRNPGWQMFAKLSPDGRQVAFVRDHDLFLTEIESGLERQLTFDGSEVILNGITDWVYEEELDLRDAFRWSPNGQRIAYWRFDQGPVSEFPLVDESSTVPTVTWLRYPKAGQRNSIVRVGSLELETGRTTWFDVSPETDGYVARMEWAASSDEVLIQRIDRRQNRLDLLLGDASTGGTTLLFSEEDDAWLEPCDDAEWIAGGEFFTWTSERDGWRHLYLFARSGQLVRQLTRGPWDVTAFHGVDEAAGRAYFSAASSSPLTRSVHSVSLDGTGMREVVGGRGTHSATFGPDYRLLIETHSTIGSPPTVALRRVEDGSLIRVLEDNRALNERLDRLDLREPEFFTVSAADGTPLNGWIIKPRDFDPQRAYPLLLYVYGGPGSQRVRDEWGGRRYLWHQMLVRRGMLVASVDNRGTGARGREFEKQVYLRLGQLESADQLAAIRQLGEQPYVDGSRIGIWGWSYGGYLALMTALRSDGAVAAAVAGAPVTAWELYDTVYTERYMRTPSENVEGYQLGSALRLADRLQSSLLLIHGTADDNVHAQHTLQLVRALEEAGKTFRMRLYPGQRHALEGEGTEVNLWQLVAGFLEDELVVSTSESAAFGLTAP